MLQKRRPTSRRACASPAATRPALYARRRRGDPRRSGGIPRTISVICDNALVSGFALDQRLIDKGIVLEVCEDFDFPEAETALYDETG